MTGRRGTQIKSRSGPADLDQVVDQWWGDDTSPLSGGHVISLNELLAKDAHARSRSDNRLAAPLYEMRQNPRRRGEQDSRGIPTSPQMVVSIFTQQSPEDLPARHRTNTSRSTPHARGGKPAQMARPPLGAISTNRLRSSNHKQPDLEPVSADLSDKVTCGREREGIGRVQIEHREKLYCMCVSSCALCVRAAVLYV